MAHLVGPLADDGFDVVVPWLPGYAFFGRPPKPIGPRAVAGLMHGLMTDALGCPRYLVQGGDWGAAIGAWMAHDNAQAVAGRDFNILIVQAEDAVPTSKAELAWAAKPAALYKREGGYAHEKESRPQTPGDAMGDSPVGVAAWILEKFGR